VSEQFEKIHTAGVERHASAWFEANMLAVSAASFHGLHVERDKEAISAIVLKVLDVAKRHYAP
jgi:hypothetical protein